MSLVDQLASSLNIKNETPNIDAAAVILKSPQRIVEIIEAIPQAEPALLGDCVEVLTMISEQQPQLVVPYADQIIPLLSHKKTRVRWEAMHCLAYLASFIPQRMSGLLPQLEEHIREDDSTIVRDYVVTALGNYGSTSQEAAQQVFPLLKMAVNVRDGKHAKLALEGFVKLVGLLPHEKDYFLRTAQAHLEGNRGSVKKAAKQLLKGVQQNF